jgi:NTE family protein
MKIGITLSGGFVKSLAHAGLLKAIDEYGLEIGAISGASSGSLIAALYAFGISPDELLDISRDLNWRKLAKPYLKGGLFKLDGLKNLLIDITGNINLEDLKIPIAISVVNLRTLKPQFFTEGPLADCVIASCPIPPLFAPWKIGEDYFVDGGIRNCLPAEFPKAAGCEINICSNVNVASEEFDPQSLKDVSIRVGIAQIIENQEKREYYCDKLIDHKLTGSAYDFEMVEEFFRKGYENGLKIAKEIKSWL